MRRMIETGTVVRFRANYFGLLNASAEVLEDQGDRGFRLRTEDSDDVHVTRHEVVVPRKGTLALPLPIRKLLPYGVWKCADGRDVLFNRDYQPIFDRRVGSGPVPADPQEWVKHIDEEKWFYSDVDPPWCDYAARRRCLAVLRDWGVLSISH